MSVAITNEFKIRVNFAAASSHVSPSNRRTKFSFPPCTFGTGQLRCTNAFSLGPSLSSLLFFHSPFFFLLAVVETETWNFFNETKDILFICWSCFHLFSKSPQHRANLNVYIFEKGLFKLRINMYSYVRTLFANDSFSKLSCYPVVE